MYMQLHDQTNFPLFEIVSDIQSPYFSENTWDVEKGRHNLFGGGAASTSKQKWTLIVVVLIALILTH